MKIETIYDEEGRIAGHKIVYDTPQVDPAEKLDELGTEIKKYVDHFLANVKEALNGKK